MNSEAKKESEYWKLNEEEDSFYHLLYLPRGIERVFSNSSGRSNISRRDRR